MSCLGQVSLLEKQDRRIDGLCQDCGWETAEYALLYVITVSVDGRIQAREQKEVQSGRATNAKGVRVPCTFPPWLPTDSKNFKAEVGHTSGKFVALNCSINFDIPPSVRIVRWEWRNYLRIENLAELRLEDQVSSI